MLSQRPVNRQLLSHQLRQHGVVGPAVCFGDLRPQLSLAALQPATLQRVQRILNLLHRRAVGGLRNILQCAGKLRAQLDANDASTEAQKNLIQNQQVELVRVNALYDNELERLKKLWAGAQPGSMGVLASTPPPPSRTR